MGWPWRTDRNGWDHDGIWNEDENDYFRDGRSNALPSANVEWRDPGVPKAVDNARNVRQVKGMCESHSAKVDYGLMSFVQYTKLGDIGPSMATGCESIARFNFDTVSATDEGGFDVAS